MGKSVPTPQYYEPQDPPPEATPLKAPESPEPEDVTDSNVKKASQQSMYFAQTQATADDDSKEKKSFYSSGTAKSMGKK